MYIGNEGANTFTAKHAQHKSTVTTSQGSSHGASVWDLSPTELGHPGCSMGVRNPKRCGAREEA